MTNGLNTCAFPHMLGSPSSYMTLQPLLSEFPYIRGKFYFLFYQCVSLLLTWMQAVHYDKSKLSFCLVVIFFVIFGVIVLTDLFLEEDGRQTGRSAGLNCLLKKASERLHRTKKEKNINKKPGKYKQTKPAYWYVI
jgi:hypothetical protein